MLALNFNQQSKAKAKQSKRSLDEGAG